MIWKMGWPTEKKGLTIRPGFGVGYGYLPKYRDVEGTHFLLVRGLIEGLYFPTPNLGVLVEVGATGGPVASISRRFMSSDLRLSARAGVVF